MTEEIERWRPVRNFVGQYEISNLGRVRSIARFVACRDGQRLIEGQILSLKIVNERYSAIVLHDGERTETVCVHRLVAEAFVVGTGEHVRHLDGDSRNNKWTNLAWGSPKENEADKARHGRTLKGLTHPRAVLNADQVRSIRDMHARGFSQLAIARATGIGRGTVGYVVRKETYIDVN